MPVAFNSNCATLQEQSCYTIANSFLATIPCMEYDSDRELIEALVAHTGLTATALAKQAGLAVTTLTRPLNHDVGHELSPRTLRRLKETFPDFPAFCPVADQPIYDNSADYLPVEILPSFAGMGGGGVHDDDVATGLISRRVIEDELRARPSDLLLVDVRGDSMEPDFHHGDQILIDKRDTNLAQPGSFCIWDGDGYVIKLVERIPQDRNKLRVFSANNRYSPYEVLAEEVRILGRPVWFARRL